MSAPIVIAPGQGHRHGNVEFLARTKDTPRFTFGIIEITVGRVLEEHVHKGEDDAFYILEGELTFTFSGDEAVAKPGTFVLAPSGTSHGSGTTATSWCGCSTCTRPPASTGASGSTTRPGPSSRPCRAGRSGPA